MGKGYVERGWRGKGVGTALLARLIDLARTLGYHKMVLAALPHNEAGLALYSRAGFTRVGIYHEQGKLDGRRRGHAITCSGTCQGAQETYVGRNSTDYHRLAAPALADECQFTLS